MTPHPDKSAHTLDDVGERSTVCANKARRHANLNKVSQHQDMSVRHAADMAAIGTDGGGELWHQYLDKSAKPRRVGAHRSLGKGKSAQRPDLVIKASHASPVHGKATDLHFDRTGKTTLKLLIRRNAIPTKIQCHACQPVPHDVGAPAGKVPVLVVGNPAGDQLAGLDARLVATLGTKVAQSCETRAVFIITIRRHLACRQSRASLRITAPGVLQAGTQQTSRCAANLPPEQAALAEHPFNARQSQGHDRCRLTVVTPHHQMPSCLTVIPSLISTVR